MIRVRRPETVRLELTGGDFLIVKKHLTAGEYRAMFRRMYLAPNGTGGEGRIDPFQVGLSKIIGYLVDWSIVDPDGQPIAIRGESESVVASAVDNVDVDSFREIQEAIDRHEIAMTEARDAEKKLQAGEMPS